MCYLRNTKGCKGYGLNCWQLVTGVTVPPRSVVRPTPVQILARGFPKIARSKPLKCFVYCLLTFLFLVQRMIIKRQSVRYLEVGSFRGTTCRRLAGRQQVRVPVWEFDFSQMFYCQLVGCLVLFSANRIFYFFNFFAETPSGGLFTATQDWKGPDPSTNSHPTDSELKRRWFEPLPQGGPASSLITTSVTS